MFRFEVTATSIDELKEKVGALNTLFAPAPVPQVVEEVVTVEDIVAVEEVEAVPTVVEVVEVVEAPVPPTRANVQYEVDSKGHPWDVRIHAATKGTNKDGSWRYRRGVTDEEIRKIEAEHAVHKPVETPKAALPPTLPPVTPSSVVVEVPTFDVPPAPAPLPMYENIPVPPPVEQKPAHSLETFRANFIPTMAALVSSGKINQAYVESVKNYFGIAEIIDVLKNEDQLKELFTNFCTSGLITKVD